MSNITGGTIIWNLDVDDSKLKSGLSSAKSEVSKASKDIDNSSSSIKNSISGIGDAFQNAEKGSKMFATSLLAVGTALTGAIGFGVKYAADLETMRMGFVTLLGSTEAADDAINMIKKDAATTPFELTGLVKANQMLTAVTKNAGQSESLLMNVGKALTAMGRSGSELDNVIYNLQQIANTGKITEIDIRQFGNAGINILELLADYYGTTKEAANEMVKSSSNAFGDLEAAFAKAGEGTGKFAKAFELQGGTFNQVLSNFKDNIGITASEIAKNTGIFDAVKRALSDVTTAIGNMAKPENIEMIKGFFKNIVDNGPIIVGIILGGLVPAFGAWAVATWTALAPLLPFIAAGAALGVIIKLVIDAMGGWEVASKKISDVFTVLGNIFTTYIKPALDSLWKTISESLLPALKSLWDQISPILIPVLKVLGAILLGTVVVAINAVILIIKGLINWWSTLATSLSWIVGQFKQMVSNIGNALSSIYHTITQPFIDAWNFVSGLLEKIKNGIKDALDPTVRHSPSLVDRVTSGIDEIKKQYAKLSDLSLPSVVGEVSYNPSVLNMEGTSQTSGGGGVVVNIREANVSKESDIDMLGREFGFRYALVK